MIIKEVVLPREKQRIAEFLSRFDLKLEQNVDQTIYLELNDNIVATVSASKYIIKCLAADPEYRNENYASILIGEMIKRLHDKKIYYYQVFTKTDYKQIFESFGFKSLLCTDKVAVLEGGEGDIIKAIQKMQMQIRFNLGIDVVNNDYDIASVVLNANPCTIGHQQLIELVAAKHKYVLVFVLEEDESYFTFSERYAMVYLALKPLANVLVLPSSKYIVSMSTFPSYFLKNADESTKEYARYDALIFKKYFMPMLGIKKRYVGTETVDYMSVYNQTLKEVLNDRLEIVTRFDENGEPISAKTVRALVKQGKIDEALKYIPRANHAVFKGMANIKLNS